MVPIWKQTTSNRSLVNGSADRTRLPLRPQLRFRAWAASRADATVAMGQNDSGSALQRVGRLKVEVRDGPRVFKDLVNHDQFGIGRRGGGGGGGARWWRTRGGSPGGTGILGARAPAGGGPARDRSHPHE